MAKPEFYLSQLARSLLDLITNTDLFRHHATLTQQEDDRFGIILAHLQKACDHAEEERDIAGNLDLIAILDDHIDTINRRAGEIKDLVAEMRAQCDGWVVSMNRTKR